MGADSINRMLATVRAYGLNLADPNARFDDFTQRAFPAPTRPTEPDPRMAPIVMPEEMEAEMEEQQVVVSPRPLGPRRPRQKANPLLPNSRPDGKMRK